MSSEHDSNQVRALILYKEGQSKFHQGDCPGSASCFFQAIGIVQGLPEDSLFDRVTFIAACNANLSASLGGVGKNEESLACSDAALKVYDRIGHIRPGETTNWFIARFNKGVALTNLGRYNEAISVFEEARAMLSDQAENAERLSSINNNIASIKKMQNPKKRWWPF